MSDLIKRAEGNENDSYGMCMIISDVDKTRFEEASQDDKQVPRAGDRCPDCTNGMFDYDGVLNLKCSFCGRAASAGCFT